MVAKELYTDGIWLVQLRGQVVMTKMLLLGVCWFHFEIMETSVYMLSIIASGIISHGPGKLRYYSLWHRKVYTADVRKGKPLGPVKNSGESE